MENILGIIPARGGSKGIPRKNLTSLAGKPLLAYTCEAALASKKLARIVLSTDDEEIAEAGRAYGVEVPFLRPSELARDQTPSIEVARHAVNWLGEVEEWRCDRVVLLQPTSPLRRAIHIDQAIQLMETTGADTVVSVVPVPHRFSPYNLMELKDGWLKEFWQEPLAFDRFRRQDLPPLYGRNGPAVLASRAEVILGSESFYGRRVVAYFMAEEESVDIDTSLDLRLAEALIARREEI